MRKEDSVISLFYNEPTKEWHFEELLKSAKISRPQLLLWLRKFLKESIVRKVKPKQKMPYYIANYENPVYQSRKKLFALNEFEKKGFLSYLAGLEKAKSVIIFGSLSRWDWYKDSDIDLFIFGDLDYLDISKYREKLNREIEIFVCKDKENLKKFKPALLRNIIEGYIVKGTLDFIEVANA